MSWKPRFGKHKLRRQIFSGDEKAMGLGQRPAKQPPFPGGQLYGMGLHQLMGTVRYPAQATPEDHR